MNTKLIKRLIALALCVGIVMSFAACANEKASEDKNAQASSSTTAKVDTTATVSENNKNESNNENKNQNDESQTTITKVAPKPDEHEGNVAINGEYTLYIGSDVLGYKEVHPENQKGKFTPKMLIKAIENETRWNLSLADEVYTGKGGMTVVFSDNSFIKQGPPENQKEEYFVYDNFSLTTVVLDSIKKTLQMNYVSEQGDPNSLDVYFCVEDKPIRVEEKEIPMDKPWDSKEFNK